MKVGVLFVGWQCEDLLDHSLCPWIAARKDHLGGHSFEICAVAVPFKGFEQPVALDRTVVALEDTLPFMDEGLISHLITSKEPLTEVEARGRALTWLVARGVDLVWQVDSDEMYTREEILRIMAFIEANPYVAWFRGSLRNAVFTPDQYLAEPFTPPRGFRTFVAIPRGPLYDKLTLHGFSADNDCIYWSQLDGSIYRQEQLPSMTIPTSVAWTRHLTWLNDERSRAKIAYQVARGWSCSFAWDDARGGLVFNAAHFARLGQPLPQTETT